MLTQNIKILFLISISFVSTVGCHKLSQKDIIEKAINKLEGPTAMRVKVKIKSVEFFAVDTTQTQIEVFLRRNINDTIIGYNYAKTEIIFQNDDTIRVEDKYNGEKLFYHYSSNEIEKQETLILEDIPSKSRIKKLYGKIEDTPIEILNDLKSALQDHPEKLYLLNDTIVNGEKCHQIYYLRFDSKENKKRCYTKEYYFIEKSTFFPIAKEVDAFGIIDGSNSYVSYYKSQIFSDYCFTKSDINNRLHIPQNPSEDFRIDNTNQSPTLKVGDDAPEWELFDMNGEVISLSSYIGKIVVLNFWGACGASAMSMETINNISLSHSTKDVVVLGMNIGFSKEAIKNYLLNNELSFPILFPAAKIALKYGIEGLPHFFIIDKNGRVEKHIHGYDDNLEMDINEAINEAMKK